MSNHIGWFGKENLGDDEMLRILEEQLPETDTLGGGTLISPGSEFFDKVLEPENTVGISLGVSADWDGHGLDTLRRLKAIYVRDFFSYTRLRSHGLDPVLSVDLWNVHVAPKRERLRRVVNLIDLSHKANDYFDRLPHFVADNAGDCEYFQMGPSHSFITGAHIFRDGKELIAYLSEAQTAITTRLHATIAAWIAGVPDLRPIIYDPKCAHFLERATVITPVEAHDTIMRHLEDIRKL